MEVDFWNKIRHADLFAIHEEVEQLRIAFFTACDILNGDKEPTRTNLEMIMTFAEVADYDLGWEHQ